VCVWVSERLLVLCCCLCFVNFFLCSYSGIWGVYMVLVVSAMFAFGTQSADDCEDSDARACKYARVWSLLCLLVCLPVCVLVCSCACVFVCLFFVCSGFFVVGCPGVL